MKDSLINLPPLPTALQPMPILPPLPDCKEYTPEPFKQLTPPPVYSPRIEDHCVPLISPTSLELLRKLDGVLRLSVMLIGSLEGGKPYLFISTAPNIENVEHREFLARGVEEIAATTTLDINHSLLQKVLPRLKDSRLRTGDEIVSNDEVQFAGAYLFGSSSDRKNLCVNGRSVGLGAINNIVFRKEPNLPPEHQPCLTAEMLRCFLTPLYNSPNTTK